MRLYMAWQLNIYKYAIFYVNVRFCKTVDARVGLDLKNILINVE